jgi:cysteinyl-tRNA synthetase
VRGVRGARRARWGWWHIECSAMSKKYLGQPFDIHCGGIDHIPVHHTNEIAQSEAAYNKSLANYWMHGEFIVINNNKMAKSAKNFITLESIKEKGISPLAYRYLLLQTHYRKQLNFTWEALVAAQNGLEHLYKSIQNLPHEEKNSSSAQEQFLAFINDDLNIPEALAFLWSSIKNKSIDQRTVLQWDEVLGLNLQKHLTTSPKSLSENIQNILQERNLARSQKNFAKSDELRKQLEELGYEVEDTKEGTKINKKLS